MKTLDYFYENYVIPIIEFLIEIGESTSRTFLNFVKYMCSCILAVCLFITLPVWLFPYKVAKAKKKQKSKLQASYEQVKGGAED